MLSGDVEGEGDGVGAGFAEWFGFGEDGWWWWGELPAGGVVVSGVFAAVGDEFGFP